MRRSLRAACYPCSNDVEADDDDAADDDADDAGVNGDEDARALTDVRPSLGWLRSDWLAKVQYIKGHT